MIELSNFHPLTALFFCSSLIVKGWKGLVIPMVLWFCLNFQDFSVHSWECMFTLGSLGVTYYLGTKMKGNTQLILGSALAAIIFHFLTSVNSLFLEPCYSKTLYGLYQSLWAGPDNSMIPSWVFLRNMMTSNMIFVGFFLIMKETILNIYIPVDKYYYGRLHHH